MDKAQVAEILIEIGTLLELKGENPFKTRAYQNGARLVRELEDDLEALVRRGLAFEKLQNWEQALESYNRAIAADSSLTIAYLYKGGVCNRLQRHQEALDSYEQALQTESTVRAP
jgi:tetratricopeptide (TPR) repeat protein